MLVNKTTLEGVFETFKGLFDDYLKAPTMMDFKPFVMEVPTSAVTVNYNWLAEVPAMRKWLGGKLVKDLKAHTYSVSTDPYEATLGVKRRDIKSDQLGIYKPQVQMLADEAKQHPLRLFAALLEDNPLCWDGQNLIDTDHPVGASTYSNKGTTALSLTTLQAGRKAMRNLVDAESRKLGIMPTTLMVPVELEDTAIQLVYSEGLSGTGNNDTNPLRKWGVEVVVNPYLTDANNWYLIDTSKAVKPVIWQVFEMPEFKAMEEGSEAAWDRAEYQYSVEADYTMAAGFPQTIYGAIVG